MGEGAFWLGGGVVVSHEDGTDGRKGDGGDGGGQRMKTGFHVCVKSIRGGKEDFFSFSWKRCPPFPLRILFFQNSLVRDWKQNCKNVLFRIRLHNSSRPCFGVFLARLVRGQIALRLGFLVLADQIHDHRPCLVKLAEPVRKGSFLLVAFEIGVALPHLVVLDDDSFEQRGDRCVIGQHEAGDAMCVWEIGGFLRESDLN